MSILLQFFLSGLFLGVSFCGLHCCFLLVPVVSRTSSGWKEGLKIGGIFASGKIIVSGILGGMASYSGVIAESIVQSRPVLITGALFFFFYAAWFFFHKGRCTSIFKTASPFLIGATDGIFPCGPMIGFIFYLVYVGRGILFGIAAGTLFAAGSVVGPVLFAGFFSPAAWKRISSKTHALIFLRIIGALIFILWGINLLVAVF